MPGCCFSEQSLGALLAKRDRVDELQEKGSRRLPAIRWRLCRHPVRRRLAPRRERRRADRGREAVPLYIALASYTDRGVQAARDSPRRLDQAKAMLARWAGASTRCT